MADEPAGRLATTMVRLRTEQDVTYAHIYQHGGIAPNTVKRIERGETPHPRAGTLRGIARGLATSKHPPHTRNRTVEEMALRELRYAAGDAVPAPGTRLTLTVHITVEDEQMAEAWAAWVALVAHRSTLTAEQIRALDALIDTLL